MYVCHSFETFALILVNVDRLLEVILNIKYPLYVSRGRINVVVITTWILCTCTCMGVFITNGFHKPKELTKKIRRIFVRKVGAIADIMYITCTIAIFFVIFYYFLVSRSTSHSTSSRRTPSFKEMSTRLRRSNIHLVIALVLSYLAFVVIPDIVMLAGYTVTCQRIFATLAYTGDA